LSGGEQQRVCIARALINDPKIILADEPTGNLDAVNEELVLRLLREFHQQGRTIVMVTHDPVVARLADRRIEFHHGKIESQEVFAMADEEQFDEVLEELWVLAEHGEIAEVERMEVHGALPVSLAMESESEIEQQACKFEHILSPEATDKICAFLGHPRTCPHGAPIPPGPCCAEQPISNVGQAVSAGRKFTRDEMNER